MWSAIRWLVLRLAAVRWLFKLGWLGMLVPVAFILKAIGLPVLMVLGIVALPILLLLLFFGLPLFMVFIGGGLLMGLLGVVLSIGLVALKIGLFVVLPVWLMFKLARMIGRACRRKPDGGTGEGPSTAPPPPHTAASETASEPATDTPIEPMD